MPAFDRRQLLTALGGLALSPLAASAAPDGDEWPQFRGPNRDGVWREKGIIARFAAPTLTPKWTAPIANGYSGPTVAAGKVYVTDHVKEPESAERIHCFDWKTGQKIWSHTYPTVYKGFIYDNGPRATVNIVGGRAYTIGSMGYVNCLDAATGKVVWARDCEKEYQAKVPGFGISADPLVDGDQVVVQIGGENGACVVSFDAKTGKERWKALSDEPGYGALVPVTQNGKKLLVVWTCHRIAGLDRETGKPMWEQPLRSPQTGDSVISPVIKGDKLFVSAWFTGAHMFRLVPDKFAIEPVWKKVGQNERTTQAIHALMCTPMWEGDHLYGIDTYGELRCVDARNGERVWSTQDAVPRGRNANAHLIKNGDLTWIFNERGDLIIAKLTPAGYQEISRANLINPTMGQSGTREGAAWSHPAFAYKHVFQRNDEKLVCASLAA